MWSHRRRLRMILSSASDAHGRRTSSSKVLPRPRRWRSAMKAGHRSHWCSEDSSSSAQSRQLSVSDIPVICCQRRRWGWCPQRNRMRSVRSAFLRDSSSSRGRVVYRAVKRGWVSGDCLSSRRMSAARVDKSKRTLGWADSEPSFASKSASSLPRRLQCPGTNKIRTSFFLQSSAIADCIRCTSPSGWLEFARVSTRVLLSQSTCADCQSSYSSSHEIALTIADISAWYELLHRPVGACHRSMMSSPLMTIIHAPPSVVPSWVDPSVYTWMSVGPVSSMAASVAANCWSLDIDLETSVIAVEAGGGRLQGWSGLGGEWSPGWYVSRPKLDRAARTVVRQSGRRSRSLTLSFRTTRRGSSTSRLFHLSAWRTLSVLDRCLSRGRSASFRTASVGVERTWWVIALAAWSWVLSSFSMLEDESQGVQAAAFYSATLRCVAM